MNTHLCSSFTVLVVLLVLPTARAQTVLYEEDFEDGSADGITDLNGTFGIGSGLGGSNYAYNKTGCCLGIMSLDGVTSDNVSIEADFLISSPAHGDFDIWLNAVGPTLHNPSMGYQVRFADASSDDPLAFIRKPPVPFTILDSTPNIISGYETHSVRVDRLGSAIDVYLDDALFMSASDSTYHGGQIMFRYWDTATIDNIKVTQIPEPTASCLLIIGFVVFFGAKNRQHH